MGLAFIFNFKGHGSSVEVTEVAAALAEPWFLEAMSVKEIDAMVVTVHMDYR